MYCIIQQIEKCILPKLSKTAEETELNPEFEIRQKNLEFNFLRILNAFGDIDLQKDYIVIAYLKILFEDLESVGPWNNTLSKDYGNKLNISFGSFYGISLKEVFSSDIIDSQEVFDTCIKILHEKICANNFKHYPSLVEVYCVLTQNVKEYGLSINAPKVLPISLYLIDDYNNCNKIKGLKCLCIVLDCLKPEVFCEGNYYEVIYRSLKNRMGEKDIDLTTLLLDCMLQLLKLLPQEVKDTKTDDVLSMTLEQLYMESNLYRKALLLKFTKNIIEIHGVNCVKRKKFKLIFCDNIDICCNDTIAHILLNDVFECFEMWIRYCWCAWRLSSDRKIISSLIKLLYVNKDEQWVSKITHLIITLINLCSSAEKKQILENLDVSDLTNLKFVECLELIKKEICKQIV